MLGYKVKLKSKIDIERNCYESEDGKVGYEGIAFNYEALKEHSFMGNNIVTLNSIIEYEDNSFAYSVSNAAGKATFIHFDWLKAIDGLEIVENIDVGSNQFKINSKYVINKKTGELKLVQDMNLCGCGQLGTESMPDGGVLCKDCVENLVTPRNYSYKPETYKFIGTQLPKDKATPTWYGVEIEISTKKAKLKDFAYKYINNVYLKADTSIRGSGHNVEVVSMPHSFKALMAEDSWLEGISKLPTNNNVANGCHVHISRTAFKDDKHYSLFYFLLHKMHDVATVIGGRELTDYCKLRPNGKVHNKTKKDKGGDRSVFLNESNNDTVEARFFIGTTSTKDLKSYIQLLESLIKYTKYHSETVSSKGWFEYVTKKPAKYYELLAKLNEIPRERFVHTVTYKEPKLIKKLLMSLSVADFGKIASILTKDGKELRIDNVYNVYLNDRILAFKKTDGRSGEISFDDIKEITIEEEE